jgi:Fic family protein
MNLDYNKLIQFDLLNDAETKLMQDREKLFELFTVFQNISNADSFIRDCPSFPGSTENIERDELVSAIGSTLAIEGIVFKEEEIKDALQKTSIKDNIQRKQQEIINSRDVYDYIKKTVREHKGEGEFVYKDEHIINIHRLFTANISYLGNQPGAYRNMNAYFGDPRKRSFCENYTDIYKAMGSFIAWLNQKTDGFLTGNIIAKAIMSHYYLTEIHPFGDGNGRTARAVEAMVLYANRINPYCFWSLANFWSAHRNEYLAHLGNIRETCDPLDFLIWGAKGYLGEVERIKGAVLKKLKYLMLRDYVSWLLNAKKQQKPEKKINQRIHRLVFLLTDSGKIPLDKFRASPEYESLYSHASSATRSRDLSKMKFLELIRISEADGKEFIEPNYEVLEKLQYRVSLG